MEDNTLIQDTSLGELERFFSPENFLLSWEIIRNSLRLEVKDRLALDVYASNRDKHLELLIELVRSGNYEPDKAERIYSPKGDKSLRPFVWLTMRDRLVYQAIANIILQNSYKDIRVLANRSVFAHIPQPPDNTGKFKPFIFEPAFPKHHFSGQFNKYSSEIVSLMARYFDMGNGWVIRTDIASYYPSIDHTVLIEVLKTYGWLTGPKLLELLGQCLSVWGSYQPQVPLKQGIPIGYEASDLLATLFLLPVDNAMASVGCRMLRYVDDMYLFVRGKERATRTLIKLDLMLQENALVRNPAKTRIERCTSENVEAKRIERELRKRLSALNTEYNGPPEDYERTQWDLYAEFLKIYSDDILSDPQKLGELESVISFILYRMEITDEKAKEVALRILDWFPHRTVHATKYLENFVDDPSVTNKLKDIARRSVYSEARIHCVDTLIRQNQIGPSQEVIEILQEWCSSAEDWQLRYEGLERLRSAPNQYRFIRAIAHQENHLHVRAKALVAWFEHSRSVEQKTEAINFALCSEHPYLQALGLFMWMRQSDIPRTHLKLSQLPAEYERLYLDQDEIDAVSTLKKNLEAYCKIKIDPQFRLSELFGNAKDMNQQIFNAYNSETDMNLTVNSLYKIVSEILVFQATGNNSLTATETLEEILSNLDGQVSSAAWRLVTSYQTILNGVRVPARERNGLISDVNFLLKHSFEALHRHQDIEISDIDNSHSDSKIKIFISYSRTDKEFARRLATDLEQKGAEIWIDIDDIPTGVKWSTAIAQGLKETDVMIVILSPASMASRNVEDEWQYFLDHDKTLMPIKWKPCEIHFQLSRIEYIDFHEQSYETALHQLCSELNRKGVNLQTTLQP